MSYLLEGTYQASCVRKKQQTIVVAQFTWLVTPLLKFYYLIWVATGNNLITCHFQANVDVSSSSSSSSSPQPSMSKLYGLSVLVEHYGKCGGGHYAVYMRVASNLDPDDLGKPLAGLGRRWFYILDQKFQRRMFCMQRPCSFSMKDCSRLLSS
jgi:hypothetical protein